MQLAGCSDLKSKERSSLAEIRKIAALSKAYQLCAKLMNLRGTRRDVQLYKSMADHTIIEKKEGQSDTRMVLLSRLEETFSTPFM